MGSKWRTAQPSRPRQDVTVSHVSSAEKLESTESIRNRKVLGIPTLYIFLQTFVELHSYI